MSTRDIEEGDDGAAGGASPKLKSLVGNEMKSLVEADRELEKK